MYQDYVKERAKQSARVQTNNNKRGKKQKAKLPPLPPLKKGK